MEDETEEVTAINAEGRHFGERIALLLHSDCEGYKGVKSRLTCQDSLETAMGSSDGMEVGREAWGENARRGCLNHGSTGTQLRFWKDFRSFEAAGI